MKLVLKNNEDLTLQVESGGTPTNVLESLSGLSGSVQDVQVSILQDNYKIEGLEARVSDKPYDADFDSLPKLCGQPMKLFCNGTPAESRVPDNWIQFTDGGYNWNGVPSALGQELINYAVTSGGHYIAVRDGAYGLKWINC